MIIMSPPEGLVRIRLAQCDTFLFARYLMNRLVDFKCICMDVTLGHDEELIRFW